MSYTNFFMAFFLNTILYRTIYSYKLFLDLLLCFKCWNKEIYWKQILCLAHYIRWFWQNAFFIGGK